jgi:cystathionine gamma-lyase
MSDAEDKAHFDTRSVHAGAQPDAETGAVMAPIYQTSTFAQKKPGLHPKYDYSRAGNPTRDRLQESLASLEQGKHALSFASGLAAIDVIVASLAPGAHVLASQDLYGGTFRLFTKHFSRYGLTFDFIDTADEGVVAETLREDTALLWLETPSNPLLTLCDIEKLSSLAHKTSEKILVGVDNTFASPALQNPLLLGADISCHSVTKYIGGHSDVIGGALVYNDDSLHEQYYFHQFARGAVSAPWDCWLLMRGIKTLGVRMERHCDNAEKLADFLEAHDKIRKVYYPGLASHPQQALAKKQMKRFGGMISIELETDLKASEKFVSERKFFTLAESLGGVESLLEHPASMTHASMPAEKRKEIGLDDALIRVSVGIENCDDLLQDLEEGLNKL